MHFNFCPVQQGENKIYRYTKPKLRVAKVLLLNNDFIIAYQFFRDEAVDEEPELVDEVEEDDDDEDEEDEDEDEEDEEEEEEEEEGHNEL